MGPRIIEFDGYASVNFVKDQHQDIVMPFAFSKGMGEWPRLCFDHEFNKEVGKIISIGEDQRGLKIKASLWEDPEDRKFLSIGYNVTNSKLDYESGTRTIYEAVLYEVSLVRVPANELATIDNWRVII